MPVFNTAPYLTMSINSVINQTHSNWELLIIDDGSTDNSWSILQEISLNDSRVKITRQDNAGVSAARNVGLRHIKGDYLCFLDSDDWLPPKSLELRLKKFSESDKIYFVDGNVEIFSENSDELQRIWRPTFIGKPLRKLLHLSDQCFFGPTWMIRWSNNDFFFDNEMRHGEDLLFYIELADWGTYTFVKGTTYCYRNRHNSAMKNIEALGEGYRELEKRLNVLNKLSLLDKVIIRLKTRKIMFLSFLHIGEIGQAFREILK